MNHLKPTYLPALLTTLLFQVAVFADEGHEHASTSVDGGGSSISEAAASMPANLLSGTSFESIAQASAAKLPELTEPIMVEGNGAGAISVEDRIGKPGESMRGVGAARRGGGLGGALKRAPASHDSHEH